LLEDDETFNYELFTGVYVNCNVQITWGWWNI